MKKVMVGGARHAGQSLRPSGAAGALCQAPNTVSASSGLFWGGGPVSGAPGACLFIGGRAGQGPYTGVS